jgi:hypothetical protein
VIERKATKEIKPKKRKSKQISDKSKKNKETRKNLNFGKY